MSIPSGGGVHFQGELLAGDEIGNFRIQRRLGSGGMGEVFAATKNGSTQVVALKALGRTSSTNLYRFKREFRALADVRHPNLVTLHELFILPNQPAFFTMELIEGVPFTTYVRRDTAPGCVPDVPRLEAAIRQLVEGVHHLHGARCVHRDLKPSNVLVTPQGRIVILDFGLVVEAEVEGLDSGVTQAGQILGTPAYMAPEQSLSQAGPAADYYGIGVMLYECLTGQLPFSGIPLVVIMSKQEQDAPDPRTLAPDVPEHLATLCLRLLARDPDLRPSGRELLAMLEGRSSFSSQTTSSGATDTRPERKAPFVGRATEMQALRDAMNDVATSGASVTVHLFGHSGYGKSALVDRFLARARNEDHALVLRGRCFARESVAYKGVDAVVDALSVHLRRMNLSERTELRPRHVGPLSRLFPVLAGLWDEGQDPVRDQASFEPAQLRGLGLSALRQLLTQLATRRALVLCVDDLQWANLDGVDLLTWIMRPPDPPPLLLLSVFRDEREDNEVLGALTDPTALEQRDVRELEVGPLSDAAAIELGRALARANGHDDSDIENLVGRANGSPFYIGQIVADQRAASGSMASLDRIVVRRIAELPAEVRAVLACVSVAGGPISVTAIDEVTGDEPSGRPLEELCTMGLLRRSGPRSSPERRMVDTVHDRIRETTVDGLDAAERTRLHLRIATALEDTGADPEMLADHYIEGGAGARAVVHLERAAQLAAQTFAFTRAVQLLRHALDRLPAGEDPERRDRLRRTLAEQLDNLGRGPEAADLLLELARESPPEEAKRLRQEAAEQLIRAGQVDRSIELLAELLESVGETLPRTSSAAIRTFLRARLRLWFRGWSYVKRDRAEVSPDLLVRLETLLTPIVGGQEALISGALHARALPLALDAGEPKLLCMAMGAELLLQAGQGNFERARELSVECQELAAQTDDREVEVHTEVNVAFGEMLSYRPGKAWRRMARLLPKFDETPGVGWMRGSVVVRYVEVSMALGRYALLEREFPQMLATARERGNLHEIASLEAYASTVALYRGEVSRAHRHMRAARTAWTIEHYGFVSFILDTAQTLLMLGTGEVDKARAGIALFDPKMHHAGLHRFKMCVDILEKMHARIVLETMLRVGHPDPSKVRRLDKVARRWRKSKDPVMRADAMFFEAALLSLHGDIEPARRLWREAEDHCDSTNLRAPLAAARSRLAEVTEGQESRDFQALADAYFHEESIERHDLFVDVFAPAGRLAVD